MTDKTMDFRLIPARVEGERELMNKPLTEQDEVNSTIVVPLTALTQSTIEIPIVRPDWKNLKAYLKTDVQSAKRLLKYNQRIDINFFLSWLSANTTKEVYDKAVIDLERVWKEGDACFQIPDGG